MILRGNLDTPFTEEEIDRALVEIDVSSQSSSVTKGPFQVFHSKTTEETVPSPEEQTPRTEVDLFGDFDWLREDQLHGLEDPFMPDLEATQYVPDLSTTDNNPYNTVSDIIQPESDENLLADDVANGSGNQNASEEYTMTVASPYRGLDDYPMEPRFMTSQNRLLIYHYVHNVVDLMVTISSHNSPWKEVHLPKALLGSGELEATGHTSNSRNALLHAVLACSAYNLASQFLHTKQDELARQYRMLGQDLFCKSVLSIGNCMQEEMSGHKPKYKELLAAMLSMISIGVSVQRAVNNPDVMTNQAFLCR
ncbi:component of the argr regulatory complex [Phlyctema vagabunda]|uniref:Component of the argr regulatory complex n=1 Tax=Phlyctema vagabunda TaxID=108571 RepID=A0ABR4P6G4_9HELO